MEFVGQLPSQVVYQRDAGHAEHHLHHNRDQFDVPCQEAASEQQRITGRAIDFGSVADSKGAVSPTTIRPA